MIKLLTACFLLAYLIVASSQRPTPLNDAALQSSPPNSPPPVYFDAPPRASGRPVWR